VRQRLETVTETVKERERARGTVVVTCETETWEQQLSALHEMTSDQTDVMIARTATAARLASITVVTRP